MARSFNGTTDKILASSNGQGTAGPLTFSAWALANSFATNPQYISFCDPSNASSFATIGADASGHSRTLFQNLTGSATVIATGTVVISTGVWAHVAGTIIFSTPNIVVIVYTNGGDKQTNSSAFTWDITPANISIGFLDRATPGSFLNGNLADCAIWNIQLTDGEILALSKGVRPSKIRPAGLIDWWDIDGLSSPEPDLSGNKNNGTVTGTAFATGPPVNMLTPRWPRFLTPAVVTSTVVQRRTLDNLGTRVGSRQLRAA